MSKNAFQDQPQERRLSGFTVGVTLGVAFWGIALIGAETLDNIEGSFPRWVCDLDLVDIVGSVCTIIAYPVAIGGWALFWGDRSPPYAWLESYPLNVVAGICLATLLGAAIGHYFAAFIHRHREID